MAKEQTPPPVAPQLKQTTEPPKEWYMNKCLLLEKDKKALEDKIDALERVLIILMDKINRR